MRRVAAELAPGSSSLECRLPSGTVLGPAERVTLLARIREEVPTYAHGVDLTLSPGEGGRSVLILRGRGRCLVGEDISQIGEHDLIEVPTLTWHQFRADVDAPLGFLCLVSAIRDKPQLPDAEDLAALRRSPAVGEFIRP